MLMYATLILAAVLAQPPQPTTPRTQPAQPRTQPAQPGAIPRAGAMTHSLDGDWQVVALEKDGRPVDGASTFTVSVRNNVATFSGGDEKNRPHAMRIEFGPNGQIRTTEQGTSDRPGAGTGTQPGGTAATERPAAGSPTTSGAKTGVYVIAGDYLAVSLHDRATGTGTTPRVRPGSTPPGAIPGTTPRTAPPAGLPGATPPATTPSTGFSASLPTEKPDICIVLKRSGSSRTPGSPGSPGSFPKR
jgi:hypothetical protein